MCTRLLSVLALAAFAASPALAQKDPGPALEVRVRSVNDLFDKAEYLGEIVNQAEQAKQAVGFVKNLADEKKGIEGIDPTRPFGLYGHFTANVIDSPVVLMIPLADEAAFLDLLRTKVELDPKKSDDGSYEVRVPNVPAPVFFRFANKTVYVTIQTAKGIDPKTLIAPKDFFTTDDGSVASAKLHLDRIPADVKKVVIGQLELGVADGKQRTDPGETPAQQKLRAWLIERLLEVASSTLNDGKQLTVRLLVAPKSDDLTAEVTLSAKDGTPTAKFVRDLGNQEGRASALATSKTANSSLGLRFTLPEKANKELAPVIDDLLKEQLDKAGEQEKQALQLAADAVMPTLKAGVLDAGVTVTAAGNGSLTALGALRVTEGGKIEQLVKTFAAFAGGQGAKFTFDVKKVGGMSLHKAVVADEGFKNQFGTDTVWFAVGDDLALVSVEPDGKAIAAAAEGKAQKVGVAGTTISITQAILATDKELKKETIRDLIDSAFGNAGPSGQDTLRITMDGGEALKVRFNLKGKALKFGVLVDQEKKK